MSFGLNNELGWEVTLELPANSLSIGRGSVNCNIRFPCRIRKVVRNITINILDHKGKKL